MSKKKPTAETAKTQDPNGQDKASDKPLEKEIGGFENRLEPTRYGSEWEVNGRCSDF